MKRMETIFIAFLLLSSPAGLRIACAAPLRKPLVTVVDLRVGEGTSVRLCNGKRVQVTLLSLRERRDPIREAVREARVTVEVDGRRVELVSAMYRLPTVTGDVKLDGPITRGYLENSSWDAWGLEKDARLRLWPAGSPSIDPATFAYPVKQRWFATDTQMANDPCYVDGGEIPSSRRIYYHSGLDFGGAEGLVRVVAATDGLVVSKAGKVLEGHSKDTPVKPRYDVVYLLDDRGWYYRYSHLQSIDPGVVLGGRVKIRQKIGILGKEGASGGWSHLHFEIKCRQPSGKWGTQAAYVFAWEAYQREYGPCLIAVARPHRVAWTGETVLLDGSRSWSPQGPIAKYEWILHDGARAEGAVIRKSYDRPGTYSEILKVTDRAGKTAYDFAVVQVFDRLHPELIPPAIHAAYTPTFNIRVGDPVIFKVRTFRTTSGFEVWDFRDGSRPFSVRSDGNVDPHAPNGYASTVHRFTRPGDFLVQVERENKRGEKAVAHLHVRVEKSDRAAPVPRTRPWRRHTIDDSSRGADGVRLKDVNGDGLLDITTGWEEGGVVRVYLNPGPSRATEKWPAVTVGEVGSPEDAVFADLDSDGVFDVVSSCEGKVKTIWFHWAPGNRKKYLDPRAWVTRPLPASVGKTRWMFSLPLQVDGRGGIDLVSGSKTPNAAVGWFECPENPRDLSAWKWHKICPAGWIMSIVPCDMDEDGDEDLLISDRKGSLRGVKWLENPGPGAEQEKEWKVHPVGAQGKQVMFLTVADLDGDGRKDILTAICAREIVFSRRLPGSPPRWKDFPIALPLGTGTGKAVRACDIDLDGRTDLVFTCENANRKSAVMWLSPPARLTDPAWLPHEISGKRRGIKYDLLELVDLDGDGDRDVITCEEAENLGVVWYENPTR